MIDKINKNTTLDYKDGLRDRCYKGSKDQYRYLTNYNYKQGWIDGAKKC
jgi:hypothetical protein